MNIALLIIYNHRYDKNIPILEKIYKGRFSNIFHIVPFYDGNGQNVIPVYESSYYFSGYISQAYTHLKGRGFTHYFIVADDMMINPSLNEDNIWNSMGIGENDNFITEFVKMQEISYRWLPVSYALKYRVKQGGAEIDKILPSREEAQKCFDFYHLPYSKIPVKNIFLKSLRDFINLIEILPGCFYPDYPLVGGYSDILFICDEIMEKFSLYCGAFAATNLWVEVAIPTALVLCSEHVVTIDNTKLSRGDLWGDAQCEFGEKYKYCLNDLISNFPSGKLFVHPVKLTMWK